MVTNKFDVSFIHNENFLPISFVLMFANVSKAYTELRFELTPAIRYPKVKG